MDNGENNEPDSSSMRRLTRRVRRPAIQDQHTDDSDRDPNFHPPQEEIIENESELSSSSTKTERRSERTCRQRQHQKVKASQDAVFEVVRS